MYNILAPSHEHHTLASFAPPAQSTRWRPPTAVLTSLLLLLLSFALCLSGTTTTHARQVVPVLGGVESAAALLAGHAPGVAVGVATVLW